MGLRTSSEKYGRKDILGWASSDLNLWNMCQLGRKEKTWIVHREILFPDKVFFFTTMLDRETKMMLSRQRCRRWKPNGRVRKAKVFETCWILDLVKNQLLGWRESSEERKIEAGHCTSLQDEHCFSTHLYSVCSSALHFSRFEGYDHLCFIFGHGKIIWGASDVTYKTSVSVCHPALKNEKIYWTDTPTLTSRLILVLGKMKTSREIRLWSTLISSVSKNCDRVEDFAATEERTLEKWRWTRKTSTKTIFVLHVDDGHRRGHTITFFLTGISLEKWSFFLPNDSSSETSDKVFSAKNCLDINNYNVCYISQQSNHRFWYRALKTPQDQWCQLYTRKKDYDSRTSSLSKEGSKYRRKPT